MLTHCNEHCGQGNVFIACLWSVTRYKIILSGYVCAREWALKTCFCNNGNANSSGQAHYRKAHSESQTKYSLFTNDIYHVNSSPTARYQQLPKEWELRCTVWEKSVRHRPAGCGTLKLTASSRWHSCLKTATLGDLFPVSIRDTEISCGSWPLVTKFL